MTDATTTVNRYIETWNERDPERRRALVAQTFSDDASYLDPARSGAGHDGIDATIETAQEQFPGHRIELSFGPDAHSDRVRFAWELVGPDGAVGGGPNSRAWPPTAASEPSPASATRLRCGNPR